MAASLLQLAPPLEPPPISWWPPALGWWLLPPLLLALAWLARLAWRHRPRRAAPPQPRETLDPLRLAALHELRHLERPYQRAAGDWLQRLNALLKRLCIQRYPDAHSHLLSGRNWLAFLDARCPAAGLSRWMVLVEGAYRNEVRLDDRAIDTLHQAIETWIRKHV